MRKILIALSGARSGILEQCPTERAKFEGIGGAVLTTSVLATISMWFALYSALDVSPVLAVPAALGWGLAIMSLDRWLVGTIPAEGRRRLQLALPRIAMAVLLGVVISTPLVLQIFRSEIDAQIVEIRQREADVFVARQSRGDVGSQVVFWRKRVSDLEKVINSNGDVPLDPATDPKIKSLTGQRDYQQKQMQRYYADWQCQLYGGSGCPRKGEGPLAAASEASYRKAKQQVDSLNGQIEARKRELTATGEASKQTRLQQARSALPQAQQQSAAAERRQSDLQTAFDKENRASGGLLIRLQALNEVSGEDVTLNGARFLLFLLFLLIECLPVAVKLMLRSGNYEKILAMEAKRELRRARENMASPTGRLFEDDDAPTSLRDIWDQKKQEPGERAYGGQGGRQAPGGRTPVPRLDHPDTRPLTEPRPGPYDQQPYGQQPYDQPEPQLPAESYGHAAPYGRPEHDDPRRSALSEPPAGFEQPRPYAKPQAAMGELPVGDPPSLEHEAIRDAVDTRITRTVDPAHRSGGLPLYSDDDEL